MRLTTMELQRWCSDGLRVMSLTTMAPITSAWCVSLVTYEFTNPTFDTVRPKAMTKARLVDTIFFGDDGQNLILFQI